MSDHVQIHSPEVVHASHMEGSDPRMQLAAALKFEPSELHDFDMADKAAGQMMGKLLAFLFCVLLFLMTGVNLWMAKNAAKGLDPQAPVAADSGSAHH